jgi:hypothetical protein
MPMLAPTSITLPSTSNGALERVHQPGRQRRCGGGLLPLALHDDEFIAADATENFARLLSATCGRRICKANRRLLRARRCHLPL